MKKLEKSILKETGGNADILLIVNSSAARAEQGKGGGVPVGMYAANIERVSAALLMAEMLAKWQLTGAIAPINELEDANGNKLADIFKEFGIGEDAEMHDSSDSVGGVH